MAGRRFERYPAPIADGPVDVAGKFDASERISDLGESWNRRMRLVLVSRREACFGTRSRHEPALGTVMPSDFLEDDLNASDQRSPLSQFVSKAFRMYIVVE